MNLSDISYFAVFGFSAIAGVFGIRIDEEPTHTVVLREGRFEIRRYAPHASASTSMEGGDDKAFMRLANYILGRNDGGARIAMTAPVVMPAASRRIGMMAFVETGSGDKAEMTFSMPKVFKLETLPKPLDPGVRLHITPERVVASIRFSGTAGARIAALNEAELRRWLEARGWTAASPARLAAYDPPFTIPFLRRNEIHIDAVESAPVNGSGSATESTTAKRGR